MKTKTTNAFLGSSNKIPKIECAYFNNYICDLNDKPINNKQIDCANCNFYIAKPDNLNVGEVIEVDNNDLELVNICKRIRVAVTKRNVSVDLKEHSGSNNLHLKKFIEECGFSFRQFVLDYLSKLQPFNLIRDQNQEYEKYVYCVVELGYRIAMYIKIRVKEKDELVISFHENQFVKNKKYFNFKLSDNCLIITKTHFPVGYRCIERISLVHGLCTLTHQVSCTVVKQDLIAVSRDKLNELYVSYANNRLQEIWDNSDYRSPLHQQAFRKFDNEKQISFTSFGAAKLNLVSLLVDSIIIENNSDTTLTNSELLKDIFSDILDDPDADSYVAAIKDRYNLENNPLSERIKNVLRVTGGIKL